MTLEEIEVVEQHEYRKQYVDNESGKHDSIEYSFAFVHFFPLPLYQW